MKRKNEYKAEIKVSGPGIISVSTAEILKTDEAHRQLAALKRLIDKGYFTERNKTCRCNCKCI